jgi:hypothetical protein
MNDVPKQSLAVLRQIAEFLEALPAEQVDDLAEGRARLTLIPWGSASPLMPAAPTRKAHNTPQSTMDVNLIVSALESAASRDQAVATLNSLKVADLKLVAAEVRVGAPATTKPALVKQIVELTVGARLTGDALRAL